MRVAWLIPLLAALVACTPFLTGAVVTTNASQVALTKANAELAGMHRRARDLALEAAATEAQARADMAKVHARYRPAWDAYDGARQAWIVASAQCAAALAIEAAQLEPDEAKITAALVALSRALDAFGGAVAALKGSP